MKVSRIVELLNADIICMEDGMQDKEFFSACGSDMMSDVLAYVKDQALLLTGLCNPQVIRTAEMMDISCVCFTRGKIPDMTMTSLAKSKGITLLSTKKTMYISCGTLYEAGLK